MSTTGCCCLLLLLFRLTHPARLQTVRVVSRFSVWTGVRVSSRGAGSGDGSDGSEPRLLRFLGRPNDTAPKALGKMMLGHPLPFDRHDWVVDRGGDEVRPFTRLLLVLLFAVGSLVCCCFSCLLSVLLFAK